MEDSTKVLVRTPMRPSAATSPACLVHIYPAGAAIGSRYPLPDHPLTLGRDEGCHIHITDDSVSRRHARIEPGKDGYTVIDLDSTSGTYVNEARVSSQKLRDGDYLHVGNCIYRFLAGGNLEAQYHEEIYRLTITDALTGIHNKRYLMEFFTRELACAVRYRRPLSVLLFDVDRFKEINEQFGHLGGDHTLRELGACLRGQIRKEDLFARYGGDEFAVVMPETDPETAKAVGEQLRHAAATHLFAYDGRPYQVTISLGAAGTQGNEWVTSVELLRKADENLYEAKRAGRNRVLA